MMQEIQVPDNSDESLFKVIRAVTDKQFKITEVTYTSKEVVFSKKVPKKYQTMSGCRTHEGVLALHLWMTAMISLKDLTSASVFVSDRDSYSSVTLTFKDGKTVVVSREKA